MSVENRLLVVDDETVVCESCQRIFEEQGYAVEVSTDAREGLRRAEAREYAAILLDIKMPDLDGIEFLQHLRQKNRDVPVIIITGFASASSEAQALRLGVVDFVTKPFSPDELTAALGRSLAKRRLMR